MRYPLTSQNSPAVMSTGNLLTLPDVARYLRVSVKTVRRLIDEGELKRIKVRGAVRIRGEDLTAYMQKLAA